MGWAIQEFEGQTTHAHNGSAGTYFATVRLFPDQDLAIVTLMNAGAPGDVLSGKIERAIYRHFVGR